MVGQLVECPHCNETIEVPLQKHAALKTEKSHPFGLNNVTITSIEVPFNQVFVLTCKVLLSASVFLILMFILVLLAGMAFGSLDFLTNYLSGR